VNDTSNSKIEILLPNDFIKWGGSLIFSRTNVHTSFRSSNSALNCSLQKLQVEMKLSCDEKNNKVFGLKSF